MTIDIDSWLVGGVMIMDDPWADGHDGGGDVVELAEEFGTVCLNYCGKHEEEHTESDIEPTRSDSRSRRTRNVVCPDCQKGTCVHPEICGRERHPHLDFPPASRWETRHLIRLNINTCPFQTVDLRHVPAEEVICRWLTENAVCNDYLPTYPATQDTAACIYEANVTSSRYRELLSTSIRRGLQEDSFIKLVTQFAQKYNLQLDQSTRLVQAVLKDDLLDREQVNPHARSTLLRWISIFNSYRSYAIRETFLDHLLEDLVKVAAYETNSHLIVQIREATARRVVLCGQAINVQSDVEVQSPYGRSVFQATTCAENKSYSRLQELDSVLPRIACEALAMAEDTPFVNDLYRTAYQVSIYIAKSTETSKDQLYVFLVKCHVSTNTLKNMTSCPLGSCGVPSYLMHNRLECPNIHSPHFITFIYKAFKALLLAFKGVEQRELVG
ncbi:uncharacterized protein [Ptychodera flava]|uniref:uncharacterized protein n=1 Tax=Ptychodera flava TaxID=63121 RepID=UPI003969D11E